MSTIAQRPPNERSKQPPPPSAGAASSTDELEDVRAAIDAGHLGLIPWALTYLPQHFTSDPAEFHWELADLADAHANLVVAAPRAHAKTTVLALARPLFLAATRRTPYTLLVSDTATQAEQRTSDIYAELLENRSITDTYPHLALPERGDYADKRVKRSTRDFITLGGIRFTSAGAGQSLRGIKDRHQRPTLIVVDDLENDDNVRTPEQREKLWDWFTKSLLNLPGADGAAVHVIGTILHRESLLARLLSEGQAGVWAQRRYRAINDGQPLWPAAWSIEKLEAQRLKIGSRAFSSEYLNEPVDTGSTLWQEAWLAANRVSKHPPLERVAVAIDPSASGDGDACGIVAGGIANGHGYTIEDNTLQGSPATWARVAIDTYHRLQADLIIAEKNQGGEMVTATLRSVLRPGEMMPRVELVWASRGKTTRADPIAALDENGKLHIVESLPKLEDELTTWTPGMASPNRLDAYVWLWSELLGEPIFEPLEPVNWD